MERQERGGSQAGGVTSEIVVRSGSSGNGAHARASAELAQRESVQEPRFRRGARLLVVTGCTPLAKHQVILSQATCLTATVNLEGGGDTGKHGQAGSTALSPSHVCRMLRSRPRTFHLDLHFPEYRADTIQRLTELWTLPQDLTKPNDVLNSQDKVWNQLRMLVDRGIRSELAVDPRPAVSSTNRSLTPSLSSDLHLPWTEHLLRHDSRTGTRG